MSNQVKIELSAAKQLLEYIADRPLREVIHHFNVLSVSIRAAEAGDEPPSVADAIAEQRAKMRASAAKLHDMAIAGQGARASATEQSKPPYDVDDIERQRDKMQEDATERHTVRVDADTKGTA